MSSNRLESWSIGGPRDSEGRPLFDLKFAYNAMLRVCQRYSNKYAISCERGSSEFDNHVQCYMWVEEKHATIKQYVDRAFKSCDWYKHENAKKYIDRTKVPHWIYYPLKEEPQVFETRGLTTEELDTYRRLVDQDPDYKATKAHKKVSKDVIFEKTLYDLACGLKDFYIRRAQKTKNVTEYKFRRRDGLYHKVSELVDTFNDDPYSDDWFDRRTWVPDQSAIHQYFLENFPRGLSFFTKNKLLIEQIIFQLKMDDLPRKYRRNENVLSSFFERLHNHSTAPTLVIGDVGNNPEEASINNASECSASTSNSSNLIRDDFVDELD